VLQALGQCLFSWDVVYTGVLQSREFRRAPIVLVLVLVKEQEMVKEGVRGVLEFRSNVR
jgi:hypothetical protein